MTKVNLKKICGNVQSFGTNRIPCDWSTLLYILSWSYSCTGQDHFLHYFFQLYHLSSSTHFSSYRTNLQREWKGSQTPSMPGHRISPSCGFMDKTIWWSTWWKGHCTWPHPDHRKGRQERFRNLHLHSFERHGYNTFHDISGSQCGASVYCQATREDWALPWTVSDTQLLCRGTSRTQHHLDTV